MKSLLNKIWFLNFRIWYLKYELNLERGGKMKEEDPEIEVLNLSTKTTHALKRENLRYIGDLFCHYNATGTYTDIRNIGRLSENEIKVAVAKYVKEKEKKDNEEK